MALPYITPNQLKSMAEKAKANGGESPTKTSQLENDSGFMTLTEADSKYAPKGDYATEDYVGSEVSAAKEEIEGTLGEYAKESQIPVAGKDYFGLTDISDGEHPDRHSMMMKNDDSVSGYATDGDSYNLAMVSKWDVADFGSRGLPTNLNGSKARPTYNDDKEIALVEDLPDVSNLATKTEIDALIKTEGAAIQVGREDKELNIKTGGRFTVNSNYEVVTSEEYPGEPGRRIIPLENNDQVAGKKTDGNGVPLIFVSKWDKVEVGGNAAPLNLNGNEDRPTYNDSDRIALEKDVPLICAIPLRTLQDKVYTEEEIAGWFGLKTMADVKVQIVRRPVFIKYGITLSGSPMYYFIPCQRAQFEKATELTLQTDGLDTKDDRFKRYTIKMDFSGTIVGGNSNVSLTIEDLYGKVPALPEDASSKTYVLKAVNGKVQWVEG